MLPPHHRAGPRSVRTPTAAARGGAQRPADTRCCRRAAPDSVTAAPASWRYSAAARIWAAVHTGHSRRSGKPRHAGPGQPRPLRANRTGRTTPGTAPSSRPTAGLTDVDVARSSTSIHSVSNRLSAMPDALYIPVAPSLGRPLKDNLSDPRCSAQHSPLPHRVPPGRSPFTVAPVNRTPAGLAEPRVGRIRRLQPSDLHPKSHYHPSARRAVRSRHSVVSSRTPVSVVPAPPRSRR